MLINRLYICKRIFQCCLIFVAAFIGGCSSSSNNETNDAITPDTNNPVEGVQNMVLALSPEQEVPPLIIEGANAEANLEFDENSNILSGTVSASGLTGDATAAHIYKGFAGYNGEVVFTLEANENLANVFSIPENTMLSADQLAEFLRGEYYINILTPMHIDGEVRGQLLPEGVRNFRAMLSGDEVVPPIVTDASGLGVVTLQYSTGLLWASIRTEGIFATDANLRQAPAGETGPIVVPLNIDPNDSSVWRADAVQADELHIRFLDGLIYFDVQTNTDPREIRGQIPGAKPLPLLQI